MSVHYKSQGFVFKKEERQEADRVFFIFTQEFGRVEIFAKAIRKITSKLRGGMQVFSISEVSFIQGKHRKTLTDAVQIKKFNHVLENPQKSDVAGKVSMLLEQFIKGQEPDPAIWNVLVDFFEKLDVYQSVLDNYTLVFYYFFWNFICALGYKPELSACTLCAKALVPPDLYFSYAEGGIICKACNQQKQTGQKVDADTVKVLRLMIKNEWETVIKLKLSESSQKILEKISRDYYTYLILNLH